MTALTIDQTALHLTPSGRFRPHPRCEGVSFRTQPGFEAGYLVSVFSYTATWRYRERHPDGDELAVVLEGAVEVLLDVGSGEHATAARKGEACVIPADAWHRLAVDVPSTVLFITPAPARTEHEEL
jgi:quercetin dioxygenase-like cupin family protein